ncbi:hypothetical protein [Lacticaseibacillus jixiensis]|uniref:hypothetical protein n=1 Tax=Lacticaseibacillus jixiensis TaxID=3231926 RepID=UPI0036F1BBEE
MLKERAARGRHQDQALAASYWPEATVTTSWSTGLASDTFVGQHPVDFDYSLPLIGRYGTPLVDQSGDHAVAEVSSMTKHWMYLGQDEVIVQSYMTLVYCVEKRHGEWRISDMTAICDADTLTPVIAGTDLHLDQDLLKSLRVSYRFLAYTRIKAGGTIDNNGIGTDRPETVAPVYAKAQAWLAAGQVKQ